MSDLPPDAFNQAVRDFEELKRSGEPISHAGRLLRVTDVYEYGYYGEPGVRCHVTLEDGSQIDFGRADEQEKTGD